MNENEQDKTISLLEVEKDNRTIFRKAHNRENPYAQISKKILRDNRLSAKAMGLMCFFLSLPDDWEINIKELVRHFSDGEKSIRAAINELVLLGYIEMQQSRGKRGRFSSTIFLIHEEPVTQLNPMNSKNISPYAQKRHAVNRHAENGSLLNTEYTETEELLKNNNNEPNPRRPENQRIVDAPKTGAPKEPVPAVVVSLIEKVHQWAIAETLVKTWLKQHSAEYILEKIEYTKSHSTTNPAGFLRKAIEHDYKKYLANDSKQEQKPPVEQIWPSYEENLVWYAGSSDEEKQRYFDETKHKHAYFEEMLKIEKVDFKSAKFLKSTWFKMMMQILGRAK